VTFQNTQELVQEYDPNHMSASPLRPTNQLNVVSAMGFWGRGHAWRLVVDSRDLSINKTEGNIQLFRSFFSVVSLYNMTSSKAQQEREANKRKLQLTHGFKSVESLFKILLKIKPAGFKNESKVGKVKGCDGDNLGQQLEFVAGRWIQLAQESQEASLAAYMSRFAPDKTDATGTTRSTRSHDQANAKPSGDSTQHEQNSST
jgi:hypothetical protein